MTNKIRLRPPVLNRPYLGRGWGFPPSFDKTTGDVRMIQEEADINESLHILFTTLPGERVMLASYGSGLQDFVFGGTDDTSLYRLKHKISDAILRFEPRIVLENVDIERDTVLDGKLKISIAYLVSATNSRSNIVFDFYLGEATNRSLT